MVKKVLQPILGVRSTRKMVKIHNTHSIKDLTKFRHISYISSLFQFLSSSCRDEFEIFVNMLRIFFRTIESLAILQQNIKFLEMCNTKTKRVWQAIFSFWNLSSKYFFYSFNIEFFYSKISFPAWKFEN